MPELHPKILAWRNARNYTAIGNLGEHIAFQILEDLGYQILATQDDLVGGVSNILEIPTRMNPEDFIVIAPDSRLLTVNAKAVASRSTSGRRKDGSLRRVHLSRGQGTVDYNTTRAELISPLDGETDGQIIKIDLLLMEAQIFDIMDDATHTPASDIIDITSYAHEILDATVGTVKPPSTIR
ncbi:hypothetical protein [Flexivirga caeni]|uniref:Uncharacterized protein n=1 Tax=Flexivirga caeni TaxID=2294115 RepID=A0A3M9MHV4_9MICO|nr:hypothetical protein [Flexivirga caeni]RNI25084.1 hypothetical protein EFY87_00030 [Flexivirga caeni]